MECAGTYQTSIAVIGANELNLACHEMNTNCLPRARSVSGTTAFILHIVSIDFGWIVDIMILNTCFRIVFNVHTSNNCN